MYKSLVCITLCLILAVKSENRIDWHVCSTSGLKIDESACQQVPRQDSRIACKNSLHQVDCVQKIKYNTAQLGRINDEVAATAANLVNDDVIVFGEIYDKDHPPSETVVIVNKQAITDFTNLQGKRLCHPGFQHDHLISTYLLKEFEMKMISDKIDCSNVNQSMLEREISAIAGYFGDSCRPGTWSQDFNEDSQLKSKYTSLCSLCPQNNCNANYTAPFSDALLCLTNRGEVAITTLAEARIFFQKSEFRQNYAYLCKNGTQSSSECSWSKMFPSILIAQRNAVPMIKTAFEKYLKDFMSNVSPQSASDTTIKTALFQILKLKPTDRIVLLEDGLTLNNYVNKRRDLPTIQNTKKCNLGIKWCTHSDGEQAKCEWLSQAALNKGIKPVIECVMEGDGEEYACLDAIQKGTADVVTSSADQAYVALKKDLNAVAFPETDPNLLSTILLVKKQNNTGIQSFNDLKNKKVCFPDYGGKEYINFIKIAKSLKQVDEKSCSFDRIISDFVSAGCLPGIRSSFITDITNEADKDKLCSLCKPAADSLTATICNNDDTNMYYGSKGAIKCVQSGDGDFAVITRNFFNARNGSDLQVLCKNGSLASYPGLEVDDNCALNVITSSEMVVKDNNPNRMNIDSLLHQLEYAFGQDSNKQFQLFDQFNSTKHLLFQDSTLGLTFPDEDNLPEFVNNYKSMLKATDNCDSGNLSVIASSYLVILMIFVTHFFILCN